MAVLTAQRPMGFCRCGAQVEPGEQFTTQSGVAVHVGCENKARGTETAPTLFALTATAPDPERKPERRFEPVYLESSTDSPRLVGQLQKTYELLSDGQWWPLTKLAERLGSLSTTASSRARDLRKIGLTVLCRRGESGREYRLVLNKTNGATNAA